MAAFRSKKYAAIMNHHFRQLIHPSTQGNFQRFTSDLMDETYISRHALLQAIYEFPAKKVHEFDRSDGWVQFKEYCFTQISS